ncbi:putative ribonuclease H-like domain-containing protein [Tanacetum coccineum]
MGKVSFEKRKSLNEDEKYAAACRYMLSATCDDEDDYIPLVITPDLPIEEPDNSLNMGDEHLDTIPATESDEVIKSSVENLVPSQDELEEFSDESCGLCLILLEDIEYVSLEEVNDEKEFDLEDIFQIQDVILREKLLNVHRLISNIESLKDNPIPIMDSDSSITSLSFSDNSLPEFESFSDHTEETRSGSTTTHANYSLVRVWICQILQEISQKRTRERMSDQEAKEIKAKAREIMPQPSTKVEENLHIKFLGNKSNVEGSSLEWIFDIDSLTNSMNYEPVTAGNQTNGDAGIETNVNAVHAGQEKASDHEYILLAFLTSDSQGLKSLDDEFVDDAGKKNEVKEQKKVIKMVKTRMLEIKKKLLENNLIKKLKDCVVGQCFNNNDLPTDPLMPNLEDSTGIFSGAYDDENVGAEADLNNLETTMNVSHIPTTRIHKDHPKDQIIKDINSAIQTRRMINFSEENAMTLVDLPKGKRAIGTKWVFRNKKDERGIVVRNKARLVTQGYTPEEGIYYDEVFALVARIEAIMLFLAYASFMGFIVYQMDVKSAFLYGTIEEEVYVCQPPGFKDP